MSAAQRRGGPGDPTDQDLFVRTVWRILDWLQSNTRGVVLGAVALTLLVGGFLYYRSYQQNLAERATSEIERIRTGLATGTDTSALGSLESFLQSYGGTPAAREARLLLARLRIRARESEKALEALGPLANAPLDHPVGYAAARLRAVAHENAGRPERAIELYRRIEEEARFPFQRHEAADLRAHLLMEQDQLREAAEIYRRLVDETAETPTADEMYAIRLGEVEARLEARGASSSGGVSSSDGAPSAAEPPSESEGTEDGPGSSGPTPPGG